MESSGPLRDTARAMSEENVGIVQRIHTSWENGVMTAGVELFDSQIVFESFMPDSNETRVARGPDQIEAFLREFLAQWRDYKIIADEFREAGDKVWVASHQAARGRQSGVEVEQPIFSVWTFRDRKVTALRFTPYRDVALEAAGLSE
jgi:ketosteroid isomerase-like protein